LSVVLSLVNCVTLLYALCFNVIIKLTKETRWRVEREGLEMEGLEWERWEARVKRLFLLFRFPMSPSVAFLNYSI
jgi:hypothetical protein